MRNADKTATAPGPGTAQAAARNRDGGTRRPARPTAVVPPPHHREDASGREADKNGDPTCHVTDDGKTVDWYTMSGYLRHSANGIACQGPDGMGSTYAPALVDALKGMDCARLAGIGGGG